jgi:hypothetical protein
MPLLSSLDPSLIFAIFKGEIGTWKSSEAISFAMGGPVYVFDWDKKMQSVGIAAKKFKIKKEDIEYDVYFDWARAKAKLEQFQILPRMSDGRKIFTIIIDSITTLGDAINQQTLAVKKEGRASGEDNKGKFIGGIAVNSIEDYNGEMAAFQELLAMLTDIHQKHKVHIIAIAHVLQTEYKSLDGKSTMSRSIVTGGKRAAAKIPAYFSEIFHFQTKNGGSQHEALTTHTGDDFARTSLPLPEVISLDNGPLFPILMKAAEKAKSEGMF